MKILAVDFGDARTGLACCDRTEYLASPVGVIQERVFERVVAKVAAAAEEFEVGLVIVGHPINMNGTEGPRAQRCAEFAAQLAEQIPVPVKLWDERGTTVSANRFLNETDTRGMKRKQVVDEVAATIILESFLAYRRNHPGEQA